MSATTIPKTDEREARAAELSLLSLYAFTRNFWGVVNTDPYVDNFHIREICNELDKYVRAIVNREYIPDLIINIPPGMSKSTIVSQMFPAFLWLHAPWAVVISSSYAQALSTEHAIKSRQIIGSEQFKRWFGRYFEERFGRELLFRKDTERHYTNNMGGARIATSTGSAITGQHGHVILRDDPMNPKQAESPAERLSTHRFNDRTLSNRKKNKVATPTITVMQRLHEDDTTGHELEKGKPIRRISLPAELTDKVRPIPERLASQYVGGLLDPERLTRAVLDENLTDLGTYGYAGQMQQEPVPEGGGKIKPEWFPRYNPADIPFARLIVHFYLDSAYTAKQENDASALLAFVVYRNQLYLIRCEAVRMEFPELIEWIRQRLALWGASEQSVLMIEPKASGLSIGQYLQRETAINVIFDKPPDSDKRVRVSAMSPIWEAGRVLVPNSGNWIKDFFDELKFFPKGKHDDRVDCLEGATRNFIFGRWELEPMAGANA